MVWHQLAISFVLFEVRIFRIKYLITELGDEFLEETTAVDSFFHLPVFVYKFDLPLGSRV